MISGHLIGGLLFPLPSASDTGCCHVDADYAATDEVNSRKQPFFTKVKHSCKSSLLSDKKKEEKKSGGLELHAICGGPSTPSEGGY